jgi:hypothetical protein
MAPAPVAGYTQALIPQARVKSPAGALVARIQTIIPVGGIDVNKRGGFLV